MAMLGIASPEALLLRQLASQRTAFAIAHPSGPIQTDMFPVLEYESPRAFFVGAAAQIFNVFDERTQQERSAPAEKRRILSGLKREEIAPVFAQFDSNNPDFMDRLAWHVDRGRVLSNFEKRYEDAPLIVRSATRSEKAFEAPTNATEMVTNILFARWLLDNGRVREGATIIERLLEANSSTDWRPASYAALAAQAC